MLLVALPRSPICIEQRAPLRRWAGPASDAAPRPLGRHRPGEVRRIVLVDHGGSTGRSTGKQWESSLLQPEPRRIAIVKRSCDQVGKEVTMGLNRCDNRLLVTL